MEKNFKLIGENLNNFQAALFQQGSSLEEYINNNYVNKWISDEIYHVSAIRTTFINSISQFLANEGLLNLEKIMMSIITDPLAHDIEHTPVISYKGNTYVTTHSMIYNKFLACSNPKVKGIYVDSPNIRLEIESPEHIQRGRYLIDFSQIDVEVKREKYFTLEDYFHKEKEVLESIHADLDKVKNMFERMIIFMCEAVNKYNADDLAALGVVLQVPTAPFPNFELDSAIKKFGKKAIEEKLGEETNAQFFWISGLMRENYDLIYPYLKPNGEKFSLSEIASKNIFNYDLVAKNINAKTGKAGIAREILSGAIREWLYEPVIERIIDNKVLASKPIFKDGNIENLDELAGYGPFLKFVAMKDKDGNPLFPSTMGGGLGVERTLFSILNGEKIKKIDDITFFGKNPDSHSIYLF